MNELIIHTHLCREVVQYYSFLRRQYTLTGKVAHAYFGSGSLAENTVT